MDGLAALPRGVGAAGGSGVVSGQLVLAAALAVGLALLTACKQSPVSVTERAAAAVSGPCSDRKIIKLGVPFVHVCPEDLAEPAGAFAPFWIGTLPNGCSVGDHGTVLCPTITPLSVPASHDRRPPEPVEPRIASMSDALLAHRVCAMRFGGRLPTRRERALAEAALGLSALAVRPQGEPPVRFDFQVIPEWVTAVPCDHPSVLGPECGVSEYPELSARAVDITTLAACRALPGEPTATQPIVSLGESCPSPGFYWPPDDHKLALPCAVRTPPIAGAATGKNFALHCAAPERSAAQPEPGEDARALFRCVLPDNAAVGTEVP